MYGKFAENGFGHTRGTFENKAGVWVPSPRVYEFEEVDVTEAVKSTMIDDGSNVLEAGQIDSKMNILAAQLSSTMGPAASGLSVAEAKRRRTVVVS